MRVVCVRSYGASDAPDGVHQVSHEQNVSIDINADTAKIVKEQKNLHCVFQ